MEIKDFQYWRQLIKNTREVILQNMGKNKFEDFSEDEQTVLAAYLLLGVGNFERAMTEYVFKEFIEEMSGLKFDDPDDLIAYMLTHGSAEFRSRLVKLAGIAAVAESNLQKIYKEG